MTHVSMGWVRSYRTFSPLPCKKRGGISLLHLSWGHPRRALPVIPALRSPDFPHPPPFGVRPRLSGPVAEILYSKKGKLSNVLQILFGRTILIFEIVKDRFSQHPLAPPLGELAKIFDFWLRR